MSSRRRHKFNIPDVVEDRSVRRSDNSTYTKRYKKGKYLGKGGFAQCWELISNDSGNKYAGKIIPKASLAKSSARRKLLNEIKIHRAINHKNVVKFQHFFEDKENVYILLEVCTNQTLMELQKRRKVLTEPEAKYFLWQLVQTMAHLHSKNIIHRDLKLGNLFIDKHMQIKVGDFGLATKLDHPAERKRTICGTPNYIAPEILDNRNGHSFEVDVWSIGVIMYTMIIGRPPFETASVKSTYKRIRDNTYSFPPNAKISTHARQLINSILQAQPERRPTINQIIDHPFFTAMTFPMDLPESCLFTPLEGFSPQRKENSGPSSSSSASTLKKSNTLQVPAAASSRLPLGERTNGRASNRRHIEVNQKYSSVPATTTTTTTTTTSTVPATTTTSSRSSATSALPAVDTATANSNLRKQQHRRSKPDFASAASGPLKAHENWDRKNPIHAEEGLQKVGMDAEDEKAFKHVHDEIEQSFSMGKRRKVDRDARSVSDPFAALKLDASPSSSSTLSGAGAHPSVMKWLDFSKKYGLGYIFSNGDAGVYFNDSSKIILSANEHNFTYIARRSSSGQGGQAQNHTLTDYPSTLEKKVTLLKHFFQYLKQKMARSEGKELTRKQKDARLAERNSNATPGSGMVYVKKWLRTRHAILFRMSNRTVQVIFFDNTQIILSSRTRMVSYTDKTANTQSYPLDSVFDVPRPDLAKRMKYIKDILYYLFSRTKVPVNK